MLYLNWGCVNMSELKKKVHLRFMHFNVVLRGNEFPLKK